MAVLWGWGGPTKVIMRLKHILKRLSNMFFFTPLTPSITQHQCYPVYTQTNINKRELTNLDTLTPLKATHVIM